MENPKNAMHRIALQVEKKMMRNLKISQLILDSTGTRVRCHTGSYILVGLDINNSIVESIDYFVTLHCNLIQYLILAIRKGKR